MIKCSPPKDVFSEIAKIAEMPIYKASGSFFPWKINSSEGPEKSTFGRLENAQMPIFITFERFTKIEGWFKKRPEKGPKTNPLGAPRKQTLGTEGGAHLTYVYAF